MATVHDVAKYVLRRQGQMTAMKLQKLVYYAQAWSLVWDEEPLFPEEIEAWANGPVSPDLYAEHKGRYTVAEHTIGVHGDADSLTPNQQDSVNIVLAEYGNRDSWWLSQLTHMEDPWRRARRGLAPGERGSTEITHAAMANYYSSLA